MPTEEKINSILSEMKKQADIIFGDKLIDAVLYGSYARGDYDGESDLDIMMRVNIERSELYEYEKKICRISSKLGLDNDILVSVHLQNNQIFEEYKNAVPFYQNVIREGRRIDV